VTVNASFVGQTVEAARRLLAAQLKKQGIDSAELDARLLTGHVVGLDLTGMITSAKRPITPDESTLLVDYARRRLHGEPIARILGSKEFWGLTFQLSSGTLVPRPDTETVVELAWRIAAPPRDRPLRILDIGTGSGAILLALLSERSDASGIGTDISVAALKTASGNAARLELARRAAFVACDYATALSGPFDLIVSNPPYIRSADIEGLATEVRDHDPRAALDGGADGLDAYREIAQETVRLLAPGGALVLELGQGQSADVRRIMAAVGLKLSGPPQRDLAGIDRAVAFQKTPR
jgi:release factor glutamine methyltransferase